MSIFSACEHSSAILRIALECFSYRNKIYTFKNQGHYCLQFFSRNKMLKHFRRLNASINNEQRQQKCCRTQSLNRTLHGLVLASPHLFEDVSWCLLQIKHLFMKLIHGSERIPPFVARRNRHWKSTSLFNVTCTNKAPDNIEKAFAAYTIWIKMSLSFHFNEIVLLGPKNNLASGEN